MGSQTVLRGAAAAALLTTAVIHLKLAPTYDPVGSDISQGALFRLQAVAAVLTAAALVVVRRSWTWWAAASVGAGSLAAVLLYRYVDVGAIGPLPSMYEPAWFRDKTISALAEVAVLLVYVVSLASGRRAGPNARS